MVFKCRDYVCYFIVAFGLRRFNVIVTVYWTYCIGSGFWVKVLFSPLLAEIEMNFVQNWFSVNCM